MISSIEEISKHIISIFDDVVIMFNENTHIMEITVSKDYTEKQVKACYDYFYCNALPFLGLVIKNNKFLSYEDYKTMKMSRFRKGLKNDKN